MRIVLIALLLALPLPASAAQTDAYRKILFVGNSLTVHFPNEAFGWPYLHGMAASQTDRDYVHRLQLMLAARQATVPDIAIVSADVNRWSEVTGETLDGQMASEFAADLVVVQMGDNAGPEIPYDQWLDVYQQIADWTPNARRMALGVWSPSKPQHEAYIQQAAAATGMQYIPISDLHIAETQASQYSHPGVAWHPNDLGMLLIAERITQALSSPVWLPWVEDGASAGTIPPQW